MASNSYLSARRPIYGITAPRPLPADCRWEVIQDPTGMFYKRFLRSIDIEVNNHTGVTYWQEGMIFRDSKTGEIRAVQGGIMNRYCVHGWGLYREWVETCKQISTAGGNPDHSRSALKAEINFKEHINTCKVCKNLITRLFMAYEQQGH